MKRKGIHIIEAFILLIKKDHEFENVSHNTVYHTKLSKGI